MRGKLKEVDGALISGSLTLDARQLGRIDDHFSLMYHFRNEVLAKWGIDASEYRQMIEEHLDDLPDDQGREDDGA